MKDIYIKYKNIYNNYILLIKSGNFYISYNNDALLMHNIFNYKIVNNGIKIGFPIQSLNKVITKLENININYIIINNGDITYKYKCKSNKYNKHISNNYLSNMNRIKYINNILTSNINNDINDILTEIERVICKINF